MVVVTVMMVVLVKCRLLVLSLFKVTGEFIALFWQFSPSFKHPVFLRRLSIPLQIGSVNVFLLT